MTDNAQFQSAVPPTAPTGAPFGGPVGPPMAGVRYAEWQQRVLAYLVDFGCIFAIMIVGAILGQITFLFSLLFGMVALAASVYVAYLNGSRGQSPGKALMGLRLVREDGSLLGGGMGILRTLTLGALGAVTFGIGSLVAVLWPLWDEPKRQALHDKVFGTIVLSGQQRRPLSKDLFLP